MQWYRLNVEEEKKILKAEFKRMLQAVRLRRGFDILYMFLRSKYWGGIVTVFVKLFFMKTNVVFDACYTGSMWFPPLYRICVWFIPAVIRISTNKSMIFKLLVKYYRIFQATISGYIQYPIMILIHFERGECTRSFRFWSNLARILILIIRGETFNPNFQISEVVNIFLWKACRILKKVWSEWLWIYYWYLLRTLREVPCPQFPS